MQHDPCRDKITPLLFSCGLNSNRSKPWACPAGLNPHRSWLLAERQFRQPGSPRAAQSMSGHNYPMTFFVGSLGRSAGLNSNRFKTNETSKSLKCAFFLFVNLQNTLAFAGIAQKPHLKRSTSCGTRTRNLRIRSPTPCPLGQGGLRIMSIVSDQSCESDLSWRQSVLWCPVEFSALRVRVVAAIRL